VERRASKTAYFFNRPLGYLALIGKDVRFPASDGVWFPVADLDRPPADVVRMLAAVYRGTSVGKTPFIALLTDADVAEFEEELRVCVSGIK
jgi:hypothetical protein